MMNEFTGLFYLLVFVLGTAIGSFLNVVIYRMPQEKSVIMPPSACGACETFLKWKDLIPLISYISLRGRCRYCQEPFSLRYPFVEGTNGLAYLVIYGTFGLTLEGFAAAFLFSLLLAVVFIDIDHMIIPDQLMLTALIIGIPLTAFQSLEKLLSGFIGLLVGGGLLLLIAIVSKGGMGGGDIKLAGILGLFLGWPQILLVLFFSFFLGAIAGLAIILYQGKTMKEAIPFGPYLAIAALIVLFWGNSILTWYQQWM
ncbi:prepilin peptidase [Heliorestis convoluta]|uniref:Prepilin leader peptidase/N-methyltransferase n=1 Tax=Heliorestis convoluta TaxID=356322 RepID=A0A5Q2MW42_9FIRM|nr:A24 family peptidase [Heliorestis convoluta]QGG46594.1 prepilin peptidase [Heliorestis convoluta]